MTPLPDQFGPEPFHILTSVQNQRIGKMIIENTLEAPLLEFITEERKKCLSAREWKFRLAGFGYGIKEDNGRSFVVQLRNGSDLGTLPSNLH